MNGHFTLNGTQIQIWAPGVKVDPELRDFVVRGSRQPPDAIEVNEEPWTLESTSQEVEGNGAEAVVYKPHWFSHDVPKNYKPKVQFVSG